MHSEDQPTVTEEALVFDMTAAEYDAALDSLDLLEDALAAADIPVDADEEEVDSMLAELLADADAGVYDAAP